LRELAPLQTAVEGRRRSSSASRRGVAWGRAARRPLRCVRLPKPFHPFHDSFIGATLDGKKERPQRERREGHSRSESPPFEGRWGDKHFSRKRALPTPRAALPGKRLVCESGVCADGGIDVPGGRNGPRVLSLPPSVRYECSYCNDG